MSNKINDKRTIRLLIGNALIRCGRIIFQIFLNIFIWKNTNDIKLVAIFNITYLTTHFLSFVGFSLITKKGYRRTLNVISLVGFACAYLFIIFLGKNLINYLPFIAFFIGIFNGMYWINFHNNQFDLTNFKNRGNFEGIKTALMLSVKIIIPSLIGFIISIDYLGYGYIFSFALGILFLLSSAIIGTVKVDVDNKDTYDIIGVFKRVIKRKNVFRSVYTYSFTGFSFSNSVIDVIIPIILFTYVGEESSLGLIISVFAVLSIISSYIFGKLVPYKYYNLSIIIVGSLYCLSILGFISFSNVKYIALFSAILNIFATLFSIPQKVFSDNVLHQMENYKMIRSEYMVIREIFLYIGWVSPFIILYFIGTIEMRYLYYLFFIIMLLVGVATYLLYGVSIKEEE